MRLILVRHGETDHNRDGRALGRADVPLNEKGLRQAAAIEFALSAESIAAIYASPRQRTMATARAIASPHDLPVVPDERLIEMDAGALDGVPFAELRERFPDFLRRWQSREGPHVAMPGATETLAAVQARARAAIEEMLSRHASQSVVAVTHNFVILSLLAWLMQIDLADFRRLRHALAAISSVEIVGSRVQVITLNNTCHLRGID